MLQAMNEMKNDCVFELSNKMQEFRGETKTIIFQFIFISAV